MADSLDACFNETTESVDPLEAIVEGTRGETIVPNDTGIGLKRIVSPLERPSKRPRTTSPPCLPALPNMQQHVINGFLEKAVSYWEIKSVDILCSTCNTEIHTHPGNMWLKEILERPTNKSDVFVVEEILQKVLHRGGLFFSGENGFWHMLSNDKAVEKMILAVKTARETQQGPSIVMLDSDERDHLSPEQRPVEGFSNRDMHICPARLFDSYDGNKALSNFVTKHQKPYFETAPHRREAYAMRMMDAIRQGGSRFLEERNLGGWYEVEHTFAMSKLLYLLRFLPRKGMPKALPPSQATNTRQVQAGSFLQIEGMARALPPPMRQPTRLYFPARPVHPVPTEAYHARRTPLLEGNYRPHAIQAPSDPPVSPVDPSLPRVPLHPGMNVDSKFKLQGQKHFVSDSFFVTVFCSLCVFQASRILLNDQWHWIGPFPSARLAFAARLSWEWLLKKEPTQPSLERVNLARDLIYDRLGMAKYVDRPMLLNQLGIKLVVTQKQQTLVRNTCESTGYELTVLAAVLPREKEWEDAVLRTFSVYKRDTRSPQQISWIFDTTS